MQAQGGADPLTGGDEVRSSKATSPTRNDESPDGTPSALRTYLRVALTAAVVLALDQATKSMALEALADGPVEVIPDVLRFRLGFNSGGAFGLFQGLPGIFLITTAVVIVVILFWIRQIEDPRWLVPLGMILGGGLGNLADRVFRDFGGRVVDFIDFHVWPIFNLADSAIVAGVLLVLILGWHPRKQQDRSEPAEPP